MTVILIDLIILSLIMFAIIDTLIKIIDCSIVFRFYRRIMPLKETILT